jgi:hypothetical protein
MICNRFYFVSLCEPKVRFEVAEHSILGDNLFLMEVTEFRRLNCRKTRLFRLGRGLQDRAKLVPSLKHVRWFAIAIML